PLIAIIGYVLAVGGGALNAQFFTQSYAPPLILGAGLDTGAVQVPAATPNTAATPDPNATPDPFANIDLGAAAGAVGGTPSPPATPDPFANIDLGAAAGQQTTATGVVAQGGVLHGIVGTLLVAGAALLLAIPIGLLAGIFLAEYPNNQVAQIVR